MAPSTALWRRGENTVSWAKNQTVMESSHVIRLTLLLFSNFWPYRLSISSLIAATIGTRFASSEGRITMFSLNSMDVERISMISKHTERERGTGGGRSQVLVLKNVIRMSIHHLALLTTMGAVLFEFFEVKGHWAIKNSISRQSSWTVPPSCL